MPRSGLPAYHPLVAAQGWDPVMVDTALRNDTVTLVKAGYNVRSESLPCP
jgi:hypothetical protein